MRINARPTGFDDNETTLHFVHVVKQAFLLLMVGLLTACAASTADAPEPERTEARAATITLGIYSGRPDPEWTLTTAEMATLDAALTALPTTTGSMPDRGLGYHGFSIAVGETTQIAFKGTITTVGLSTDNVRTDPSRSIERLLLTTGRPHLTATEYETVHGALAPGR
jgi:hypothetical protein